MTYSPSDFGPGKSGDQIREYRERLDAHGVPPVWTEEDEERTRIWQGWQGWTGDDADGLPGPVTLARLFAPAPGEVEEPEPEPEPEQPSGEHGVDWSIWKWTGPVEGDEDDGDPIELDPIEDDYPPYFVDHGTHVTLRAPVDGATTSNSGYPRSEFREMEDGDEAAWSSRSGTHRMKGRCRVTELPDGKDEVTIAQIHDDEDDVVMIVVSGSEIYLSESLGKGMGSNRRLIDTDYQLGDVIDYEILATPGGIRTTVNGTSLNTSRVVDDAYFKAGCYSQANEDNGSGAAEVDYEALEVEHV